MYYGKYGINTCKTIISFIPKGNLDIVIISPDNEFNARLLRFIQEVKKRCYTYEELGPTVDVQLNKEIVKISVGKASNGWSYDPYYEQVATVSVKE